LPTNITGRQIAKLRNEKGLSQDQLAGKCQRIGWDASRNIVAKIESGIRCVSDQEILLLSQALGVSVSDLFPRGKKR
jgi:transcriptional regulator with XRE-family HTH domain